MVECLLAGMKDASIARELGVSQRTVARRVASLLEELKSDTRFTAGFKLALRLQERGGKASARHLDAGKRAISVASPE